MFIFSVLWIVWLQFARDSAICGSNCNLLALSFFGVGRIIFIAIICIFEKNGICDNCDPYRSIINSIGLKLSCLIGMAGFGISHILIGSFPYTDLLYPYFILYYTSSAVIGNCLPIAIASYFKKVRIFNITCF